MTATANGGGPGLSPDLSFDGESGQLSTFSYTRRGAVTGGAARNGALGVDVSSVSAPSHLRWDVDRVPQDNSYASLRFWARMNSRDSSQSVDLVTVANRAGFRNFDLFITSGTPYFKWDIFSANADQSNFVVTTGQWYLIEVLVDYSGSEHTAEVRIDGVNQGTIRSTGSDSAVATVTFGSFSNKTHSQAYDDITLFTDDQPLGFNPGDGGGGNGDVTVTWTPVVDNGSGVREYEIWRNGQWYDYVPGGTTTYIDRNPVNGAFYQLRAVDNAINRSGWSARTFVDNAGVDTTPPRIPDGITLTPNGNGGAVLSWDATTDTGGSGLREYAIFRNGQWIGWVAAPGTSYTLTTVSPGEGYQVAAYDRALNLSGKSFRIVAQ